MTTATPKWAKVRKQAHDKEDVHTVKSEFLFRIKATLQWKRRLHQAQTNAWNQLLQESSVIIETTRTTAKGDEEVVGGTMAAGPDNDGRNLPSSDNNNKENEDDHYSQFCCFDQGKTSADFPFEILPCTFVIPPTCCIVDRHALADALRWNLRTRKATTSFVIWLPRFLTSLHATLHLILDRVIQQEPNPQLQYLLRKMRRKSKRSTSLQDLILFWASQTMATNATVQIIIEDLGGFEQERVREEFFHTIQEWRSQQGLPVSLIILSIHNTESSNNNNIPTSYFGRFGMSLRHIRLDAQDWMTHFWNQLLAQVDKKSDDQQNDTLQQSSSSCCGLPLSSRTMHRIIQQQKGIGSLSQLVERLGQSITEDFGTNMGSFSWDVTIRPEFLAWFCTYETSKNLLALPSNNNKNGANQTLQALKQCRRIQREYIHWYRLQLQSLILLQTTKMKSLQANGVNTEMRRLAILADMHCVLSSSRQETPEANASKTSLEYKETEYAFEILQRYLNRGGDDDTGFSAPPQANNATKSSTARSSSGEDATIDTSATILNLVNEIIILIGHLGDHNKSADKASLPSPQVIETGICQMLNQLDRSIGSNMEECMKEWKTINPLYQHTNEEDDDDDHHVVFLRRDIIQDLPHPAQAMYGLLRNRLSITRHEWYEELGANDTFQFSVGVMTLLTSGLIKVKWGRGGKVIYEKVSVVWCQE